MIIKDATDASTFATMVIEEILVAPFFETGIEILLDCTSISGNFIVSDCAKTKQGTIMKKIK